MNDFTIVDLLRHGEPEGGQMFRGAVDDPLSLRGWEQMRAAVGDCRDWNTVITSPLIRCAAFARELAERLDRPLEIVDGLRAGDQVAGHGAILLKPYIIQALQARPAARRAARTCRPHR